MKKQAKISNAVIKRLPRYRRYLKELRKKGVDKISSNEFSTLIGYTASQIRQDLNNFGGFGQQGYGYSVDGLYHEISAILGLDKQYKMVVVGAGNLGQAIVNHTYYYKSGFIVSAIFEVNPKLIGLRINDIEVMDYENIRISMEKKVSNMTEENNRQLAEMRNTVDEKLQKTLEERIGRSFRQVSESLQQVTRGLGEMQNLAAGVGDLKKVLSNVKTRGIVGEIQLGAIFQQILSPEQYEENIAVKGGSERVEYAVKFPGEGDRPVYLPIDSKFPGDAYLNLQDAYDTGDRQLIKIATDNLRNAVIKAAKDIRSKYIQPPQTTEFAILFLPFEGLYAEVLRLGIVESLQRDYRINIAGPTTMAAMLNSFQMGFKSIALQRRSGEVWDTLAKVRTEFEKFGNVLVKTQTKMEQAQKDLETLVGVRTRGIQRALKNVSVLGEETEDEYEHLCDR